MHSRPRFSIARGEGSHAHANLSRGTSTRAYGASNRVQNARIGMRQCALESAATVSRAQKGTHTQLPSGYQKDWRSCCVRQASEARRALLAFRLPASLLSGLPCTLTTWPAEHEKDVEFNHSRMNKFRASLTRHQQPDCHLKARSTRLANACSLPVENAIENPAHLNS